MPKLRREREQASDRSPKGPYLSRADARVVHELSPQTGSAGGGDVVFGMVADEADLCWRRVQPSTQSLERGWVGLGHTESLRGADHVEQGQEPRRSELGCLLVLAPVGQQSRAQSAVSEVGQQIHCPRVRRPRTFVVLEVHREQGVESFFGRGDRQPQPRQERVEAAPLLVGEAEVAGPPRLEVLVLGGEPQRDHLLGGLDPQTADEAADCGPRGRVVVEQRAVQVEGDDGEESHGTHRTGKCQTDAVKMHPHQHTIELSQVEALVAQQFPSWARMSINPVASHGTVNALFRLGEDRVARFPLEPGDVDEKRRWLTDEADSARWLHGRVPVATPEPIAMGEPGEGYPLPWMVYDWLPGAPLDAVGPVDAPELAEELAGVVLALRTIDTWGRSFDGTGRGGWLTAHDALVADYIQHSQGMMDCAALTRLWGELRETPRVDAPDVWTHGDLMPGNLLVNGDRLSAVIDVGGLRPADPALDLQPAWNLLTGKARSRFRVALGSDDSEWDRGRGWAFAQAIGCLAYYRLTNPVMSAIAHRTLTALLDDPR